MSTVQTLSLRLIDIPKGRLRSPDPDWAACLGAMFKETGQKTPIDVVARSNRYELVTGAHRLMGAKLIKWKQIDARILTPDEGQSADHLRLHEILDNLAQRPLTALERCEAFYDLKQIHEALHPETKNGGDRKSQAAKNKQENQIAIFAFCSSAAETTGLSRRSVELAIQIFQGLTPHSRERLKDTPFAEKQSDLKVLAALDREMQSKVLDLILGEPPRTLADALVIADGGQPVTSGERLLRTVSDSLVKLPKASRSAVFRQHKREIVDLVRREGWLDAS